ncbi:hypothetical protein M4914_06735 [Streptomyces somaliensis DSM 40738]|uniref:Secreted protein n=1 Tax=Streptomyces somaliensis (strain ATCC 33201 / DSM 40738 / JCM 12659 / KCTC 9044 / NCTC 11332 / NRRL B-12077 / IP 733) TaxID=1134445 RepID=A0AA44DDZ4_STRE0|nr:hypothetical protein [Streptomyces somaliensis]MCQ0022679.1 hypothetical protein [Streptomyces somaliensis DSM 40738]NKY15118.1 hypothetical protein [Streptomyces somaliensis DSM 40738]
MSQAILILALLFVAFVALGVYVSVKTVRAAKRGVDRTLTQARRTVEDTTLRARSYGQAGVAGELAQLRLSLRTSMRATQDVLDAGAPQDASLRASLELFRRLSAHGHELDEELKRLERDPDKAGVAGRLADLRERTRRITESADSLRWAARDRAQRFAQDDLDLLGPQIDMEAGALRHWSEPEPPGAADRGGPKTAAAPEREHPAGTAASGHDRARAEWPEPTAGSAPTQVWPAGADAEPGARRADGSGPAEADRPAITARDPRLETGYPWQRTTRPETTN